MEAVMKVSAIKLILLTLSALCLHSCNDVQNTEDDLTNDSDTTKKSTLNCFTDSGITDTSIPKPIIKISFKYTTGDNISYRSIKDLVSINLLDTCVSNPASPDNCLENWRDNYYIKYKWEITESPTPLSPDSQLELPDSSGGPGQWIYDCPRDNPKRAEFTALKVTPVKSNEENSNFDEYKCAKNCGTKPENSEDEDYPLQFAEFIKCHQKYCEQFKTKYYKVNVQAVTADKNSGNISVTTDVTVIPRIIPAGRVQVQLSWKQGFKTKTESDSNKKDGSTIDLDLHLIKKNSLEADRLAEYGYERTDGVLGTNARPTDIDDNFKNDPEYWRYFLHDDCSFSDKGAESPDKDAESPDIRETIKWHASLDLDNTWGGNNFETPETINLGPIDDKDRDGVPYKTIYDDQYLVVAGYVNCTSKYEDKRNTCDPDYKGDGAVNEVDARVEIMVDGVEVPRNARGLIPADNFSESTKNFKIKHQEWKVVAVIKWDNSIAGGDAIVSDVSMPEFDIETDAESYKICRFDYTDGVMVPIWNKIDYYTFVESQRNPYDPASEPIGECY